MSLAEPARATALGPRRMPARLRGLPAGPALRRAAPTGFALANAVAFLIVRPGVPDLWAARARASAVAHGVGLTYWFSWFGGSTPGDYSVITPYLCSVFGTAVVAAAATVLTCALASTLLGGCRRPVAASWVAAFAAVVNLWCGRVPFLVGAALGVGALMFVARRRTVPAAAVAVLSVLASPVSGVFLGLGLSGVLLSGRARCYRFAALVTMACTGGTILALGAIFGVPGPEPLPLYLIGEIVLAIVLMLFLAPAGHLRFTLLTCAAVALVLFVVPNGMGANLNRMVLFALPPVVVALSRRGGKALAMLVLPILALGALSSVSAVRSATEPGSTAAYYTPLTAELDSLRAGPDHRLELVGAGHAAYSVLLDHAVLARGWETQQDRALDAVLYARSLDAAGYRRWLDENAVGYVALDRGSGSTPEAHVLRALRPGYLHRVWVSPRWELFEVVHATPIVSAPARLENSTQASMTVQMPCACTATVRVRWSKLLDVTPRLPAGTPDSVEDSVHAYLTHDRSGWTTLTTDRPGSYVLS